MLSVIFVIRRFGSRPIAQGSACSWCTCCRIATFKQLNLVNNTGHSRTHTSNVVMQKEPSSVAVIQDCLPIKGTFTLFSKRQSCWIWIAFLGPAKLLEQGLLALIGLTVFGEEPGAGHADDLFLVQLWTGLTSGVGVVDDVTAATSVRDDRSQSRIFGLVHFSCNGERRHRTAVGVAAHGLPLKRAHGRRSRWSLTDVNHRPGVDSFPVSGIDRRRWSKPIASGDVDGSLTSVLATQLLIIRRLWRTDNDVIVIKVEACVALVNDAPSHWRRRWAHHAWCSSWSTISHRWKRIDCAAATCCRVLSVRLILWRLLWRLPADAEPFIVRCSGVGISEPVSRGYIGVGAQASSLICGIMMWKHVRDTPRTNIVKLFLL